ncbi:MAG TPA: hypothetical protein VFK54_00035 [Candidatus Limnocylindrales bacterium]|nr:hypothetical protein [Candidatus Limnocylindrales bacterium]
MSQAHPARPARPLDRTDDPLDPPTNDDLLHGGSGWADSDGAVVGKPTREPAPSDTSDTRDDPSPAAPGGGDVEALGAGALGGAAIGGVVAGAPGALIGGLVGAAAGAAAATSDEEAAGADATNAGTGSKPRS